MKNTTSPLASLFVSTYEMPKHLRLVCSALERQSVSDIEISFCDDGSGEETRCIISDFIKKNRFKSVHVWQEHQGFRKCKILNQALAQSQSDYCIFLDGDCVPHRHYVLDHLQNREEDRYLAGRRVEVGPQLSASLTPQMIAKGYFDWPQLSLMKSFTTGDSEYFNRSIRFPFYPLRRALGMSKIVDMKGCNYSVSRKALEQLNGFDESYEGYGREDTDVEIRLQNLGLKIKSLKGIALQFHIWHPRREFTPANDTRLEELKKSGRFRCERGLTL